MSWALVNLIEIGLFLGSGKVLASAGPGGAVLAYAIMGTVISSVISSVGEMTALMPVNAPMMEFPRRFLDRGVGFAVGWVYWYAFPRHSLGIVLMMCRFSYVIMGADQIVTVASAIRFQYGDDRTFISWETGMNTNPAIWISLFLVAVVILNMIPVKVSYFLSTTVASLRSNILPLVLWRIRIPRRMHQDYLYCDADSDDVHSQRHGA